MSNTNQTLADNFGNALLDVAHAGKTDDVIKILKTHPNLAVVDKNGNSPLHLATLSGNLNCVAYLLRQKFDPTLKNQDLETPAMIVAKSNAPRKWSTIRLFLDYVHSKKDAELFGLNEVLLEAVKANEFSLAKKLLEKGAKPISVDKKHEQGCLHYAVINDNADMIKLLMHHHADSTQVSKYHKTPLTLASYRVSIDYQDWTAFRTIVQCEMEKRHGTKPEDNFNQISRCFSAALNEYIQSKYIYNWQFVRHHDRAVSFAKTLKTIKTTTDMLQLLKSQIQLFDEDANERELKGTGKHQQLPHNHTKDGYNQLLEDFLEIFERLQNKETIEHLSIIKPIHLARSESDSALLGKEKEEKYSVPRKVVV